MKKNEQKNVQDILKTTTLLKEIEKDLNKWKAISCS